MVKLQQKISKGMGVGMAVLSFRSIRAGKYIDLIMLMGSCFLEEIVINFGVLWILKKRVLIG